MRNHARPPEHPCSTALPLKPLAVAFAVLALLCSRTPAAEETPPAEVEIAVKKIALSHIDPARCIKILQVFGYATAETGKPLDKTNLPCIVSLPGTTFTKLPDDKKMDFPQTETDSLNELMVFFDASKPQQFSEVLAKVTSYIDLPARQIMIEVMVLEISSGSLAELGVEWDLDRGALSDHSWFVEHTTGNFKIGNLRLPDGSAFVDPAVEATITDVFQAFKVQLRALILSRTARVLSRPSVLTLDNRMAHIDVSERIPVAESKYLATGYVSQVSFKDTIAGIQLTVRPRVSRDGTEVGMQVVASVTAEIPGGREVVRDSENREVASAPRISVREVRTYARIPDNTPFIIGGLVAEDDQDANREVPILARIPIIGKLFRTSDKRAGKREVIIVLTPHVLPDDESIAGDLPRDEDAFDSFGHELFRDAYRIRAEDVFNLSFLTDNQQISRLQKLADTIIADDYRLADVPPFAQFQEGAIPGERILVYRQMYEVIKRKCLHDNFGPNKLIFLKPGEKVEAGLGVTFLSQYLGALMAREPGLGSVLPEKELAGIDAPPRTSEPPLEPTKAVALIFKSTEGSESIDDVMMTPVPEVRIVDCPDDETWGKLLWDMNQPDESGQRRHTVLLRTKGDFNRLLRAVLLRETVDLNASTRKLSLKSFALGHILLLPMVKPEKVYLIDADVAKYFFYTEQYYAAVKQEMMEAIDAFRVMLSEPSMQKYRIDAEPAGLPVPAQP